MANQPWSMLLADLFNPTAAYPLYHLILKLWMALFGAGELALRMPSAIAGALAVVAIYRFGHALARAGHALEPQDVAAPRRAALGAALIAVGAPFAIWYSQEAKTYSLLLLAAALIGWATVRVLRGGTAIRWLQLALIVVVAIAVHRLAALVVLGAALALLVDRWSRLRLVFRIGAIAGLALAATGLFVAMSRGLGSDRAASGAYIPAGPPEALWLTFSRFSLDRWPGDVPFWWLLPWMALLLGGSIALLADLRSPRRRAARILLCLLLAPTGLFLVQLLSTRLYEARYLIGVYPFWALLLAWPLLHPRRWVQRATAAGMALAALSGGLALFQPTFGIFSGDPVKEQYREAIGELAARVHPDDAVVLHPSYIRPLYNYYMDRFSSDPVPTPIGFADFWQGETTYGQREWDSERRAKLVGYTRSFLLIAPEHAKTVDKPLPGDKYGLVGNFWAFSREQSNWPCGIWRFNGAHLLCQEAPEAYYSGEVLQPETAQQAIFGENLRLLGFTLKATAPDGPGVYRAGGNLPISLFWDVKASPKHDYSFFLHLCHNCESPPPAGEDGPPLEGYLPTSNWLPGKPARDDRAIALPEDLPPGRYTLLLGVYRPDDPTIDGRLSVTGGTTLGNDRLVLAEIEIIGDE
ncbi:MAG: DUF2723 domain-containing protein [Oscillochloris sp.]|nr:DUF2723 domain-containing protein [Oscillochloris sp.]